MKILVFDFDGTIADSKKLYISMIYSSLLEHSLIYPKSHITRALGPKLEATLKRINHFSPDLLQKLKKNINSDIAKKAKSLKLCPYAKETLEKLHEKNKIILLTNSAGRFAKQVLKHNKILKYFDKLFYQAKRTR
jgi:phosphoglycolate phosphatase-like HAD superfamily hydrolase